MQFLSSLSFGAPWVLLALAILPAIYFLLRVTPPLPRRVVFPPLRLLLGIERTDETPARTPWWLLLLRLIVAAVAILALAEPRIGEARGVQGGGPIVLVVDNGWTAAHGWDRREALIADIIGTAAHSDRGVVLVPTASPADMAVLDAGEATRRAGALVPQAWHADRMHAANAIAKTHFAVKPEILWLSDGIDDGHAQEATDILAKTGDLKIYSDAPDTGALALLPPANSANGFDVTVLRAGTEDVRDGVVESIGAHGETLAAAHFRFAAGSDRANAKIVLPLEVRNHTARIAIAGEDSAGAIQLQGEGAARRAVGLVSASNIESEQPLLSDLFYLERALSPYADLSKGTISDLIARHISLLVLADIGKVAGADHDRVAKFVEGGGVLVRFAGERMANEADDLVPVKLRSGGRYLGGALAWAAPQHLAPFPDASPFSGLSIPPDVTISRQILAEPSIALADHSWARLADGTPLVTAEARGKGWIVLFHITASPAWSTLPLSGLYVDMLRRLLALANGTHPQDMAGSLPALQTLDGFGRLGRAAPDALPIRASLLAKTVPSRSHPPGFYGARGAAIAFNAVARDTTLMPMDDLGARTEFYGDTRLIALQAPLLIATFLLLLLDALIALSLRGLVPDMRRLFAGSLPVFVALALLHPGAARADDAFDQKAALDTRLAYVVTGLPDVDEMSRAGLTGLGLALKARTSYEPQDPIGVDIAKDDLSFFPLLYWPMDPREKDLSPQALSKLADYMRNGGTILFDTRDLTLGAVRGSGSPGQQTLRRLTAGLDLPPLQPIPADHVLTKAFYLLQDFPGRWDGGKVWVEALPPTDPDAGPAGGGDGVSPVIIGGNDWAAAWAVDASGHPLVDVVPGGEAQREKSIRFGINLVMYALTGNYKADQVHVPAILKRLGQ